MGEALLVKFGGAAENVPVVEPDSTSLLVTVFSYGGKTVPANTPVNCNDSGQWYNYETNDKGQVLFKVKSSTCSIQVSNIRKMAGSYRNIQYIDQGTGRSSVSGLVHGQERNLNITLPYVSINNKSINNNINIQVLSTNYIDCLLIGGGSGGNRVSAGGGAACNIGRRVSIDRNTVYQILIGTSSYGRSGGTTSAFGLSAVGGSLTAPGGSGTYRGGVANGAPNYTNSTLSPFTINSGVGWGGYNNIGVCNVWLSIGDQKNSTYLWCTMEVDNWGYVPSPYMWFHTLKYPNIYLPHNSTWINSSRSTVGFQYSAMFSGFSIYGTSENSISTSTIIDKVVSRAVDNYDYITKPPYGQGGCLGHISVPNTLGGDGIVIIKSNS